MIDMLTGVETISCSNNAGIVGLAYTQALRPGVKASFGIAIDTQRLNAGE